MSSEAAGGTASYWRGCEVLWHIREPSRRTALHRNQIVDAAIGIADREGLGAVTMRNVARQLNTAPMSLYRHVPDKDALLSMMVDRAIEISRGGRPWPRPEGWRSGLEAVATSTWRLCRRHRWFPEASIARPPITPNGVAGFEFALSLFDDVPIDPGTKAEFVGAVYATVVSSAFHLAIHEAARSRSRRPVEDFHAEVATVVAHIVASGEFPRVTEFITEAAHHPDDEAQMRARVALILDGIAARLAVAAARAPATSGATGTVPGPVARTRRNRVLRSEAP